MKQLFQEHIELRTQQLFMALEKNQIDSLIIESGFPHYYFMDDQKNFFKPNPHFLLFCPDMGEGHILKIDKGKKPQLYYYAPSDFWHETSSLKGEFWEDFFDITLFDDYNNIWNKILTPKSKQTIISPHPESAIEKGCEYATESLISNINWFRITKTNYEIECVKEANRIASIGHKAAKDAFFENKTERQIFNDYLSATQQREAELPYGNIIAFDEKAAVLHYQNTRVTGEGHTFLIDAGARYNGYCSDITRTYFKPDVSPIFKELHSKLDSIQKELCSLVKPGFNYEDIQNLAHKKITDTLCSLNIIKSSAEEALEKKLSQTFYPHGVGHALGIQVHDVGGKQTDDIGTTSNSSDNHPFLRTLRVIQLNDILTIEPGVYFIPLLLEEIKSGPHSKLLNWELIRSLLPCGGIRIEDNIVAEKNEPLNLTRLFLKD